MCSVVLKEGKKVQKCATRALNEAFASFTNSRSASKVHGLKLSPRSKLLLVQFEESVEFDDDVHRALGSFSFLNLLGSTAIRA